MTIEQQRKMLECAAKSCGVELDEETREPFTIDDEGWYWWNPLTNPADTAEMCAKLDINTFYYMSLPKVECSLEDAGDEQVIRYSVGYADNSGEKLKAWMWAATMCAAKNAGYKE